MSRVLQEGALREKPPMMNEPPMDGGDLASIDGVIRKHRASPNALIEVLHFVEREFGYLRVDVLEHVARALDLPPSKVYGVATFYHFFSLEPKARHECVVCTGTTCYVKRGNEIASAVSDAFSPGQQAAPDKRELSIHVTRCFGNCCRAPLVKVDGEMIGDASSERVIDEIRRVLATPNEDVEPSPKREGDR